MDVLITTTNKMTNSEQEKLSNINIYSSHDISSRKQPPPPQQKRRNVGLFFMNLIVTGFSYYALVQFHSEIFFTILFK